MLWRSTSFAISSRSSALTNGNTACAEFHDGDKPAVKKCMALDLATGTYSDAKPPAEVKGPIEYKYDDGVTKACTNGNCVTLDLPKLPKNDPPIQYTIHASDDGK